MRVFKKCLKYDTIALLNPHNALTFGAIVLVYIAISALELGVAMNSYAGFDRPIFWFLYGGMPFGSVAVIPHIKVWVSSSLLLGFVAQFHSERSYQNLYLLHRFSYRYTWTLSKICILFGLTTLWMVAKWVCYQLLCALFSGWFSEKTMCTEFWIANAIGAASIFSAFTLYLALLSLIKKAHIAVGIALTMSVLSTFSREINYIYPFGYQYAFRLWVGDYSTGSSWQSVVIQLAIFNFLAAVVAMVADQRTRIG